MINLLWRLVKFLSHRLTLCVSFRLTFKIE
jgi:hypothetical protein